MCHFFFSIINTCIYTHRHTQTHVHTYRHTQKYIHGYTHTCTHAQTHIAYTYILLTWAQLTYDKQDNCLQVSLGYDGLYPEKPIRKVQTSKQKMCLLHLIESASQLGSRVHWRASGFHGDQEEDQELLPNSTRGSHTSYHNLGQRYELKKCGFHPMHRAFPPVQIKIVSLNHLFNYL